MIFKINLRFDMRHTLMLQLINLEGDLFIDYKILKIIKQFQFFETRGDMNAARLDSLLLKENTPA